MVFALLHVWLGVALLGFSVAAAAREPGQAPRIGYLAAVTASADAPRLEAFRRGLRELGYVEGRNIVIEYRHATLDSGRLPELAAELVSADIDVLVAVTTNAALAARRATGTIPIVFMGVTDPVAAGLVQSLARPGGNSTGVTNMAAELAGKRLELLKEALPSVSQVAVLWDPQAPGSVPQWQGSQEPADKLRLKLQSMPVSAAEDYVAKFKTVAQSRHSAVWVTLNPVANSNQKMIAELAIASRLPSICARSDYADNGCLMAYGPGYSTEGRDGARYLDRILRGAKPGDLPVEQPTTFELVINLKTARRIGVTVPPAVLGRADRVIE